MADDNKEKGKYTALYRLKKKMDTGKLMFGSDVRAVMAVTKSERYAPTEGEITTITNTIMEIKDTIESQHECPREVALDVISYRLEEVAKRNPHIDWNQHEEDLDKEAEFQEILNKLEDPREFRAYAMSAHHAQIRQTRLDKVTALKAMKEFLKRSCKKETP